MAYSYFAMILHARVRLPLFLFFAFWLALSFFILHPPCPGHAANPATAHRPPCYRTTLACFATAFAHAPLGVQPYNLFAPPLWPIPPGGGGVRYRTVLVSNEKAPAHHGKAGGVTHKKYVKMGGGSSAPALFARAANLHSEVGSAGRGGVRAPSVNCKL